MTVISTCSILPTLKKSCMTPPYQEKEAYVCTFSASYIYWTALLWAIQKPFQVQVQPSWPKCSLHCHVWRSKMAEGKSSRGRQWLVLFSRSLCWYFLPFQMFLLCRSKPHPGGKMPSQGEDLAILSLCNHSIIGVRQFLNTGWRSGRWWSWVHVLTLSAGGELWDFRIYRVFFSLVPP